MKFSYKKFHCFLSFFFLKICFMHMGVLPAFMFVHHWHAYDFWGQKRGTGSPETGVTNGCEPCGCWKLNQGPLEDSQPLSHLSSLKICSFTGILKKMINGLMLIWKYSVSALNWKGIKQQLSLGRNGFEPLAKLMAAKNYICKCM